MGSKKIRQRQTIIANYLTTICWFNDLIVDWASAGKWYSLDGKTGQFGKYHYAFTFDSCVISQNGHYAFIYKRLGTKGLLLKNGELLREINRSYNWASAYDYPVAFANVGNITYLIHCPIACNRLDFENAETGEIITNIPKRKPSDVFHSRLEVNQDNSFLMSKGWVWHPLDIVEVFKIEDCIKNPLLLDKSGLSPKLDVEICTANFIDSSNVLIGSSNEIIDEDAVDLPVKHLAIWNLAANQITNSINVKSEFGNIYAINKRFAWDTFDFPKIIDLKTGEIVEKDETIDSGKQNSSIITDSDKLPLIAFNQQTKQLAIAKNNKIEVLTPSEFISSSL